MMKLQYWIANYCTFRYTVEYIEDGATQSNICQDQIRTLKNRKKRKIPSFTPKSKKKKQSSGVKRRGPGRPPKSANKTANMTQTMMERYLPKEAELRLAKEMGLPKGWTAKVRSGSRYTFRSPDGTTKIHGIKKVFDHLGLPVPAHGVRIGDESFTEDSNDSIVDIEEGDPPWRDSGNELIGRKVKISVEGVEEIGIVKGWISETDVDKDGAAGYTSEKTGKPAALFHVCCVDKGPILSQDLEEFEVIENLVD